MKPQRALLTLLALLLLPMLPAVASSRALSVDVWTNRGNDGVYQPGDPIRIKVRASEDAYVLVYEIDADGYVHTLFPNDRSSGLLEGRQTYSIGDDRSDADLVAEGPTGQGYIVAVASIDPFRPAPWYLRPTDLQAQELGYEGGPEDDNEGVTAEGRIVGDPFVAMERIRRRIVDNPTDGDVFATSYASYFVGHEVRYPRYLCYDCHRPNRWAWWDGFDPYYAHCSVFDFRVNYSWYWGPTYWFGSVPYYVYVYRTDCPPRYRLPGRRSWSSWDGWGRWQSLWGGSLRRYKSPPPQDYVPPSKYDGEFRRPTTRQLPPGFIASSPKERLGRRVGVPQGRQQDTGGRGGTGDRVRRESPQIRDEGGSGQRQNGGSVGRGGARPVPETPTPPAVRDNRQNPPEPQRRERPTPTPEPARDPGRNVDRSPRQDPPPAPPPPPPQRTPRQSSRDDDSGGGRLRRR